MTPGNMATFAADFSAGFQQLGAVPQRDDRHRADRPVGHGAGDCLRHPLGILSSENTVPWWVYQPICRVMDACRSINEMVFAMLFGGGWFGAICWRTGVVYPHDRSAGQLFAEAVEAMIRPVKRAYYRCQRPAGSDLRGDPAGPAAVDLLLTCTACRVQRALGRRGRQWLGLAGSG